jgi:hypothetical protein
MFRKTHDTENQILGKGILSLPIQAKMFVKNILHWYPSFLEIHAYNTCYW